MFRPELTGTASVDWVLLVAAIVVTAIGLRRLTRLGPDVPLEVGATGCAAVAAIALGRPGAGAAAAAGALVLVVPAVAALGRATPRRTGRAHGLVVGGAGSAAAAAVLVALGTVQPFLGFVVGAVVGGALAHSALRRARGRPDRRSPLRWAVALAVLAGLAWLTAQALLAREDLLEARDLAEEGLDAATAGDVERAQVAVQASAARFDSAHDRLGAPVVQVLRLVPGLAQNVRSAEQLAGTAADALAAVDAVARRATADQLRPVDGRFPLEAFDELHVALLEARAVLDGSAARLERLAPDFLSSPVSGGVDTLDREVARTARSLELAADAVDLAPALLGGDGPRRWFVGVLTLSERRGAGGLLGDYALVDVDDGRLELTRSGPIGDLNGSTPNDLQAAALPTVYDEQYGTWRVGDFWQNLTVTPDFPTIGAAITGLSTIAGVGPVGGVVSIDPLALEGLLAVTGPVEVAAWPAPIAAEDVADILLLDQYRAIPDLVQRAAFQADLVEAVVEALTSGDLDPAALLDALGPAIDGGHLRLYSPAPEEQALFARLGADGELRAPAIGDYLSVVSQNGSQSKIDYFLRRSIEYAVEVDPATGATTATLRVTLTNEAPTEGLDAFVIGGGGDAVTAAGEMRCFTTIFSALDVTSVAIDGGPPLPVAVGTEAGLRTGTVQHRIPAGTTQVLTFELAGQVVVDDHYRLLVDHQPGFHADEVTVAALGATRTREVRSPWSLALLLPESADP